MSVEAPLNNRKIPTPTIMVSVGICITSRIPMYYLLSRLPYKHSRSTVVGAPNDNHLE
ncbi:hypothetical protein AB1A63_08200 [Lactiplantibacillus paraplantarum]|uniref:hypothetical protein n=1 Tax=Lactiplantibacillus paraplantarum TaxID=60520 RepID=UPI0021A90838|nr:hypothetical protein [Lactiplantibacillus paraplantarum]